MQLALKERKRERFLYWLGIGASFVVGLFLQELLGGPWLLWFLLWLAVVLPLSWVAVSKGEDVRMLRWEIAYTKGTMGQPLEEPKDYSKGKLALGVTFLGIILGAAIQLVGLLLRN